MKHSDFDKEQLLALIAEVLDGSLDDTGHASLNGLLKASPEARRFYRDHMELHARLHLDYAGGQAAESMPGAVVRRRSSWFSGRRLAVVAAAACLALLAVIAWPRQSGTEGFATLENARAARWESSDLPTTEGSRLGQGTLRLAEGLVTLRFDSGAEVNLEAPVELTLVDAMHCDGGEPMRELRADGGAAANNALMQFQSDILDLPVIRPQLLETTAAGAAFLAGLGTGMWQTPEEIEGILEEDRRFVPAMDAAERKRRYDGWRRAVERGRDDRREM